MMHRRDFDPWAEPAPLPDYVLKIEAKRKAGRAFLRGTIFGVLLGFGACVASAAFSLDISGSTVTLEPSADPAAFADVVFVNDLSNGPTDTGTYTLVQDGITVGVAFTWDANFIGMDQVVITPPLGITCLPVECMVTVIEGQTGRVTLFWYQGS